MQTATQEIDRLPGSGEEVQEAPGSGGGGRPIASALRIVHTVSSMQVGGMEQFALRLAAAQRARGHAAAIVALKGGPLLEEARRLGVPVRVLAGAHRALRIGDGALAMARLRPHVVHAHNPTSLHYALLGRMVCGARVVMTDHGQGLGGARVPADHEWRRTDAVVAVSDAVARRCQIPAIREKTRVIRNGVEPAPSGRERAALRAELGLPVDRFVGIIVARIDGLKGHETLLKAIARLKQSGDPALRMTLLIAGDGGKRARYEALAEALGLTQEWLRFLGFRADAPDLLAASDLFLLPSLTEGLPLSILEAMTHGLPVIATPVGGVPEVVVAGQTGILVPTEDEGALAGAIATLIRAAPMRRALGEAGRERALREFSFERMVARYEALYRGSLRSRAGCRVPGAG